MAIYRLLQNAAFGPDEIKTMTDAYENVLGSLGLLADRNAPITEDIAKTIINLAQTGERDPARMAKLTLAKLGRPPSTSKPQMGS